MLEYTISLCIFSLFTGAICYLLLCVDPNNPGILGKMHRFVYKYLPSLFNKICGGEESRFFKGLNNICNYLCYTNHPLVQFFYILVSPGGFCLYWYAGFSVHFDDNPNISYIHKYIAIIFSFTSFYTYYLACKTSPGEINKTNVKSYIKKYDSYYDNIIYHKNNKCKTCNFDKPARSKHCSTCKMCVSKFDHHCIWIRQCVGEKNYKHFLTFLIMHSALCLYGLYIGLSCFYGMILKEQLLQAQFRAADGSVVKATWSIIIRYMFFRETMFVFIVILCGIMGLTLLLFYLYHLSLVRSGMTTNEKIKRSDCMTYIKKAVKETLERAENEENDEKKQEYNKKLERLTADYEKLEQWPKKSLFESLKDIYQA